MHTAQRQSGAAGTPAGSDPRRQSPTPDPVRDTSGDDRARVMEWLHLVGPYLTESQSLILLALIGGQTMGVKS